MADILLRINNVGLIEQIYFDHSSRKVEFKHSIFSFFDNETSALLSEKLLESKNNETIIFSTPQFTHFVILPVGIQFIVFATSLQLNPQQTELIMNLIQTIANDFNSQVQNNLSDVRGLYEQMQLLNNELVNKGRIIEKMNRQLNDLNAIQKELIRTDPLTKLISRYQYTHEIAAMIAESPQKKGLFCYMDIDNFKSINDTYGHETGDRYLVEFANRLNQLQIDHCIKMRIAGDEFGLYIHGLDDTSLKQCHHFWQLILHSVIYPIELDGVVYPLSISAGFAAYPDDAVDIPILFDRADKALYVAKNSGKNNFSCYHCGV